MTASGGRGGPPSAVKEARRLKRERIQDGVKVARARGLDLSATGPRAELAAHFGREHLLARPLARRYAEAVAAIVLAFPDGDAPEDLIDGHADALARHDEPFARSLVGSDEHQVLVLRGTQTVVRRVYRWLDEGDELRVSGRRFRARRVSHEPAQDPAAGGNGPPGVGPTSGPGEGASVEDRASIEDARREGYATPEDRRRGWAELQPRALPGGAAAGLAFRHELEPLDGLEGRRRSRHPMTGGRDARRAGETPAPPLLGSGHRPTAWTPSRPAGGRASPSSSAIRRSSPLTRRTARASAVAAPGSSGRRASARSRRSSPARRARAAA